MIHPTHLPFSHANHTIPDNDMQDGDSDEISSLISDMGNVPLEEEHATASKKSSHSQYPDITGIALLYKTEFWQLWILMGLLTGVGLMTIKLVWHSAAGVRVLTRTATLAMMSRLSGTIGTAVREKIWWPTASSGTCL